MAEKIRVHHDLKVYQVAFEAAMVIFEATKEFPSEERYGLTDQMRRSSRSVCANLAEARRLLANCRMRRGKRPRHRSGWNLRCGAIICLEIRRRRFSSSMMSYWLCLFQ